MNAEHDSLTTDTGLPESDLVYDYEQIMTALDQLAMKLNVKLAGTNPVVICMMNGGLIFTGHLVTKFTFKCEIDYIHTARYHNTTRGTNLEWLAYPKIPIKGRTVLILDDILDEGDTLDAVEKYCYAEGADRVEVAVLLQKKHDRCCYELASDNIALTVEDRYVFGFGMDYGGQYRYLNAVYALKGEGE